MLYNIKMNIIAILIRLDLMLGKRMYIGNNPNIYLIKLFVAGPIVHMENKG